MTDYDTSWLVELQQQRHKEGSAQQSPKQCYFIMDYTAVETSYDQAFTADDDDIHVGNGIVVTDWNYEFFPNTPAGRAELFEALTYFNHDTDYDDCPTTEDSIDYIAEFFDLEYQFSSRMWAEKPRMDLLFLTRADGERFLELYPAVCEAPHRAVVTSTNTYRTSTVAKLLHLIDTIDCERSTIVLKDDTSYSA